METLTNKGLVYEFGRFVLDPEGRTLYADGKPLHLPAKEFETLLMLVENNGRALSKEEMMSALWQGAFVEEVNLAKQISKLRKIFNTNGDRFIETLPKHGYRFTAELRRAIIEADEPVIVEKHTLKRITFAVENQTEPRRALLPPARGTFYTFPALLLLVAMVGVSYLAWHYGQGIVSPDSAIIDPYDPVRLTDNPLDDTGPNWNKDGRIRFSRFYPDNRIESWIMNADGTGQSAIPMPDGKRIFSWSPDEQKVLFQKQGDATRTYMSNADGSAEILLPFRSGNWSADSRMLVYRFKVSESNHDIFVYSIDTGKSRNVTNSEFFDADPSFSPDGTRIVFGSARDGNGEIYVINLDGTNLRRLTFDPKSDAHPAFSPDGTQIVFTSDRENENGDVYVMNADGSNPVKVTNLDKSNETAGAGGWSPDGTKIAFSSDRNGKDDIYIVSAETVRPKVVLSDPKHDLRAPSYSPDGKRIVYNKEAEDKSGEIRILNLETGQTSLVKKTELALTSPAWSPDGHWIAFHDRIDGNTEVCLIQPDGKGLQNLTNDPLQDVSPSWSPDGRRIAFISGRGDSPGTQLYIMNADGGDPRPITRQKGFEGEPAWWPDGSGIVFVCDRTDSPGNLLDICRINLGGSGEERVLFHRGHDSHPAVSPDGNRIAFTASSDGNLEIYLMNRDGSGRLRLTRNAADDQLPEWSPDGKKLTFLSNRGGKFAVYEVEVH